MMSPPGTWSLIIFLIWSFGCTKAQSVTGQVVTVITTSTATALSDCTCTQTFSRARTKHETSTTSDLDTSLSSTAGISGTDVSTTSSEASADPTSVSISGTETNLPSTQFTLSVCPTRITNPTYTPPSPLPTDYTWGCPPHHLCRPNRKTENGECNFEAGPPADTYYCSPEQCIPSPFLLPPQFWGQPALSDQVGYFRVSPGYFNLDPHEFGLDYNIFLFPGPSQSLKRELSIRIPGKCYDECNDAMLEAESSGKTPDLCESDSAFLTLVRSCQFCVASVDLPRISTATLPQFQQFLYYCEGARNLSSSASISSTSTILKSTALQSAKSTSNTLKAAPTTNLSAPVSTTTELTTTELTTTEPKKAASTTAVSTIGVSTTAVPSPTALIMGSMVSPVFTETTSTMRHPIELSTRTGTDPATLTRTEWSPTSSISNPFLTSDGSLLHVRWYFCFASVLFVLFLEI